MFVYLHVPFCASRCIYCDFYVVLDKPKARQSTSAPQPDRRLTYVDAVIEEIHGRLAPLPAAQRTAIQTIYVGGGTPSLLPAEDYKRIWAAFCEYTSATETAEFTLEANPNQMIDRPESYLRMGFNRISVGVQSLNDIELKKLSRGHTAQDAKDFIGRLKAAGWENISIDLMYGIPGQTDESWANTLEQALALDIQHISMYGLKVEEQTALARLLQHPVAQSAYLMPSDDETVERYYQAVQALHVDGFEQYEFSNFCRPGFESRHNLNYWQNGAYYAFGVSAHGYVPAQNTAKGVTQMLRYETVRDLEAYLANPMSGHVTPCPPEEQLENALIFGLRLNKGISVSQLEQTHGIDFRQQYGPVIQKYMLDDLMRWEGDTLRLTPQAVPVSNMILADFLSV